MKIELEQNGGAKCMYNVDVDIIGATSTYVPPSPGKSTARCKAGEL